MPYRLTIIAVLLALAWGGTAAAQTPSTAGLQVARSGVDRIVRVIGRQLQGQPGDAGIGIVLGERSGAQGGTVLIVAVPDSLVRDPQRPELRYEPPSVIFMTDPSRPVSAQLLDPRLAPEAGNLAVLSVPKPAAFRARPLPAANTSLLIAGAPAWQVGRANDWTPAAAPGRFSRREPPGWLILDGLDNGPGTAGAPVVTERGLIGMLVGPPGQVARALPVEVIATRLRGWGLPFELATPDGSAPVVAGGLGAVPEQARPSAAPSVAGLGGPVQPSAEGPAGLVLLLPAEAEARAAWVPPGARISPWMNQPVRLYGAPRPNAPQIGMLPPGRALPGMLVARGAYDIVRKLDGGAWFLLEVGGQPIGYVAGADVIEVWPMQGTTGLAGGKVVREWSGPGGKTAVLRDTGNAYELETAVTCKAVFCDSIVVFTPAPPSPGATVPSFQAPTHAGAWRENDVVSLRLQLPRRVVETASARLMACIGRDGDCDMQVLLPPS